MDAREGQYSLTSAAGDDSPTFLWFAVLGTLCQNPGRITVGVNITYIVRTNWIVRINVNQWAPTPLISLPGSPTAPDSSSLANASES